MTNDKKIIGFESKISCMYTPSQEMQSERRFVYSAKWR